MSELRDALERADGAFRDLLNLTLNVTREGSAANFGLSDGDRASPQQAHEPSEPGAVPRVKRTTASAAGAELAAGVTPSLSDQQKRLVDNFMVNCKRLENHFAEQETERSKMKVLAETAELEAELAVKNLLLESVAKDLAKWTATPGAPGGPAASSSTAMESESS